MIDTKRILEAALMAADEPLSIDRLRALFTDEEAINAADIRDALTELENDMQDRSVELKELASGFVLQVRAEFSTWVSRLWVERPPRYSRALLETLALIAYRQPVTRAEIEDIRGVAVSSHIMKTLQDREWIHVVGHRDVPGKPGLYATTKHFLDYFNLKTLSELPTLAQLTDLDKLDIQINLNVAPAVDEEVSENVVVTEETVAASESEEISPAVETV